MHRSRLTKLGARSRPHPPLFAREQAEGRLEQAVAAYEAAGETEAVVRLYLEPLKNPVKAFTIARKARQIYACSRAAFCFLRAGLPPSARFRVPLTPPLPPAIPRLSGDRISRGRSTRPT